MFMSKIKTKLLNFAWGILTNIPKLKETIFRFYAWRIFEIVPKLKDFIYKIYDKFWYIELIINNKNFDLKKIQIDNYIIEIDRLKRAIKSTKTNIENLYANENNWDLVENLRDVITSNEYVLLKKHFVDNIEWKKIKEYNEFLKDFSRDQPVGDFSNEREFLNLLDQLDQAFHDFNPQKTIEKVLVGIDRSGGYVVVSGLFIVSLLKLLKRKTISIEVVVRHPQWSKFSSEFLKFQSIHGELYQPLIHPDLSFKSSYTDERFLIIKHNISVEPGTLLDIGANLGYFCHKFEDLGFNCYAVEIRPSNVHYMKKLRDIEGKRFKIINKSIFDLREKLEFDVVLAFNIFHHFLREKELYHKLIEFLNHLTVSTMYFQPHDPSEAIMKNAYINYGNEQFVKFIIKNSCLNNFELVNKQSDGRTRPIYRIFK